MLLTFTIPLPKSCAAYKLQTVEISKRFGDNAVVASLPKWQEILCSVRPRAEPAPTCTASTESAPRPEALAPLTDPVSALTQARAEPAPTCTASTESAPRPEALVEQPAPPTVVTSDATSAAVALLEQSLSDAPLTQTSKERPQRSSTRTRKRPVGGPIQAA
jgi:hypothetical protein